MKRALGVVSLALVLLLSPQGASGSARAEVDGERLGRAIDAGVTALRRYQTREGTWPWPEIGATALATITLIECGAAIDDPQVVAALHKARQASVRENKTYSLSLLILLFDKVGDPRDIPLIESLTVRLLAGQLRGGGWTYDCPNLPAGEQARLQRLLARGVDKDSARVTAEKRRKIEDLAPEVKRQLAMVARGPAPGLGEGGGDRQGDNSNTQFAVLALWVARRYGLPIEGALTRINLSFRTTQHSSGGWGYVSGAGLAAEPTAAMTCAGILALAVAHGTAMEAIDLRAGAGVPGGKPEDPKRPPRKPKKIDIASDRNLLAGIIALSSAVGNPGGRVPRIGEQAYYYLWSLERVGMVLGVDKINGKDWYNWGAEILLANQRADGTWRGTHSPSIDTCFALLFLKRSNLATDLTTRLRGKTGLEKELRAGGVGGEALKAGKLPSGLKGGGGSSPRAGGPDTPKPPVVKDEATLLADAVLEAPEAKRGDLLDKMSSTRGSDNTRGLLSVIARAEADTRAQARSALALRLSRFTPASLKAYLKLDDPELRRAAALAVGMKESRELIPDLIGVLEDREDFVVRAALGSLKALTRQDFGPAPGATRGERARAVTQWRAWWARQR